MKDFKNVNSFDILEKMKQSNFNDEDGFIIRQFLVSNLDLLFKIAFDYRNDLAFRVQYNGELYSMYKKDDNIFLKIREWNENLTPVTEDYDICAGYEKVKQHIIKHSEKNKHMVR